MKSSDWQALKSEASPTVRAAMEKADGSAVPVSAKPAKASIRLPRKRKMSKTEQEYEVMLQRDFPGCHVLYEPFALNIPGGRYSPDFVVMNGATILACHEVKGSYRLHSAGRSHLAFKAAIETFPMWKWFYAEKKPDGRWLVTPSTP